MIVKVEVTALETIFWHSLELLDMGVEEEWI